METKVLRSAIQTYPIIFWIPTHDSTLLSNKARMFAFSNRLFVVDMAGVEQGNVSREEFMEEPKSDVFYGFEADDGVA